MNIQIESMKPKINFRDFQLQLDSFVKDMQSFNEINKDVMNELKKSWVKAKDNFSKELKSYIDLEANYFNGKHATKPEFDTGKKDSDM